MGLLNLSELSGGPAQRSFVKLSRGRAGRVVRPVRSRGRGRGFSGLGEEADCGASPVLGPGESSSCCPGIGWVVYDASESPYALCERAQARLTGGSGSSAAYTSPDYAAQYAAERRAAEAELEAKRKALDARRLALEESQFQQRLRGAMIQAQLKAAQAKANSSPTAVAARAAADRADRAAMAAFDEDKKRKQVTYMALAAVAAKLLFF